MQRATASEAFWSNRRGRYPEPRTARSGADRRGQGLQAHRRGRRVQRPAHPRAWWPLFLFVDAAPALRVGGLQIPDHLRVEPRRHAGPVRDRRRHVRHDDDRLHRPRRRAAHRHRVGALRQRVRPRPARPPAGGAPRPPGRRAQPDLRHVGPLLPPAPPRGHQPVADRPPRLHPVLPHHPAGVRLLDVRGRHRRRAHGAADHRLGDPGGALPGAPGWSARRPWPWAAAGGG